MARNRIGALLCMLISGYIILIAHSFKFYQLSFPDMSASLKLFPLYLALIKTLKT